MLELIIHVVTLLVLFLWYISCFVLSAFFWVYSREKVLFGYVWDLVLRYLSDLQILQVHNSRTNVWRTRKIVVTLAIPQKDWIFEVHSFCFNWKRCRQCWGTFACTIQASFHLLCPFVLVLLRLTVYEFMPCVFSFLFYDQDYTEDLLQIQLLLAFLQPGKQIRGVVSSIQETNLKTCFPVQFLNRQ